LARVRRGPPEREEGGGGASLPPPPPRGPEPGARKRLALLTGPVENPPRPRARDVAAVDRDLPVHDDVREALGVVARGRDPGAVAPRRGIEGREVRRHAFLQDAPVLELGARGREGGHLPDGLLEREELLVAHVLAEDAGGGRPRARVRLLLREDAVLGHG